MNKYQEFSIRPIETDFAAHAKSNYSPLHFIDNDEVKIASKIVQLPETFDNSISKEETLTKRKKSRAIKPCTFTNICPSEEVEVASVNSATLFRLFVKNGEYVYVRPHDILMIESCDHMVKVYLAVNDKLKKAIRHNTLKDFLQLLPQGHFLRIGRFCAINMHRISGGNCNEQSFEFDFKISIKLKHGLSKSAFGNIGT